ncbi:integrin alpha [Myxococcota bacterium]|nr:integrin alpha [Myxococcota bacterium]
MPGSKSWALGCGIGLIGAALGTGCLQPPGSDDDASDDDAADDDASDDDAADDDVDPDLDVPAEDADHRIEGEASFDVAGWSLGVGDLLGDETDDLVVGAVGAALPTDTPDQHGYGYGRGAVFVLPGPPPHDLDSLDVAAVVLSGEVPGDGAGMAVALVPDVAGPGLSLAVGAPHNGRNGPWAGAVYVFPPGSAGSGRASLDTAPLILLGPSEGVQAGYSLAGGDFDGDGAGDLLVGAPGDALGTSSGVAFLLYGPLEPGVRSLGEAPVVIAGEGTFQMVGHAVASAGDVSGDGIDDVIVGAPDYGESTRGGAAIFFGPVGAGIREFRNADALILGDVADAPTGAGCAVAGLDDVDGDGWKDVAVGSCYAPGYSYTGVVHVVRGPLDGEIDLGEVPGRLVGETPSATFQGMSLAGHDLDEDGLGDLLVGIPGVAAPGLDAGSAYAWVGPFPDVESSLSDADVRFRPEGVGSWLGASLAPIRGWTDTAARGVAVGAPGYPDGVGRGGVYVFGWP